MENTLKRYEVLFEGTIQEGTKGIAVQLQYGMEGSPTELVIAEKYLDTNSNELKFSKGRQIRIPFNSTKIDELIQYLQAVKKANAKVKKEVASPVVTKSVNELTDEELQALLNERKAQKQQKESAELVLSQTKTRRQARTNTLKK